MDEDSRTTGAVTYRFLRGLGIGGLAAIASLGLASRVHATYFHKAMFFSRFSQKLPRKRNFLLVQGHFDRIIDVVRINYVFKACKWEIPDKGNDNAGKKKKRIYLGRTVGGDCHYCIIDGDIDAQLTTCSPTRGGDILLFQPEAIGDCLDYLCTGQ